jgi:hypothetical protein
MTVNIHMYVHVYIYRDISRSKISISLSSAGFYHTTFVWVSDQLELEKITGLRIVTPAFAGFMTGTLGST